MTEWFVERLPAPLYNRNEEVGQRWKEVQAETAALMAWLPRVPEHDWARVEQAGGLFARHVGPFSAWGSFYDEMLKAPLEDTVRSHVLWVLADVYMLAGLPDRALAVAQAKKEFDLQRGAEREAAIAGGLLPSPWHSLQWALGRKIAPAVGET